jgi:hypothetical protein
MRGRHKRAACESRLMRLKRLYGFGDNNTGNGSGLVPTNVNSNLSNPATTLATAPTHRAATGRRRNRNIRHPTPFQSNVYDPATRAYLSPCNYLQFPPSSSTNQTNDATSFLGGNPYNAASHIGGEWNTHLEANMHPSTPSSSTDGTMYTGSDATQGIPHTAGGMANLRGIVEGAQYGYAMRYGSPASAIAGQGHAHRGENVMAGNTATGETGGGEDGTAMEDDDSVPVDPELEVYARLLRTDEEGDSTGSNEQGGMD